LSIGIQIRSGDSSSPSNPRHQVDSIYEPTTDASKSALTTGHGQLTTDNGQLTTDHGQLTISGQLTTDRRM
jgi:hypothetical protein